MKIKEMLRYFLLREGKHKTHKNEYGCLMIYLDFKKEDWDKIQELIDDEDLYTVKNDPTYGRENEPHVTILYGFHEDIPYDELEIQILKIKKPRLSIKDVSSFNNEFDVLKFDIESPSLHKLNDKFRKFPHTNRYTDYHPHVTIAYLKKGKAKKYIDKIKKLGDMKIKPEKIVYSGVDDTKKEYDF
jgi:2'-5' RNA ligase